MTLWKNSQEELPGDTLMYAGDRILMIVMERPAPDKPLTPRLVILEATESGWDATDDAYAGYGPEDSIFWAWERDVCGAAL